MNPRLWMILPVWGLLIAALPAQSVQKPSAGRVVRHENFTSKYIKPRHIDVWLPEGYSDQKRYPVVYMHDGQMLFDATDTWNHQEWGVDETLDSLIAHRTVSPCIVVGIWNTPLRRIEYFPAKAFANIPVAWQDSLRKDYGVPDVKPLSDEYLRFIVEELKPFIDRNYSTRAEAKYTSIMGSSMGGLISMYAICEYPDVFGRAACLSTHWPGSIRRNETAVSNALLQYLDAYLPSKKGHKIYFDYGTATLDAWYEPHQRKADAIMLRHGYSKKNWVTLRFEGADHSENAWRRRLHLPLVFLLKR